MAVGYEGAALLDGQIFLCTGLSSPEARPQLESASAFKGSVTNPTQGLAGPHAFDWPDNTGSVSFDVNVPIVELVKNWISSRADSKVVSVYPNKGASQIFNECFWTSMTLTASEGSAVSGTIDFLAIERSSETIADDFISNRTGNLASGGIPGYTVNILRNSTLGAIAGGIGDDQPIPFWRSFISSSAVPTNVEVMGWTFTINQEVQKFFRCEGIASDAIAPFRVGIGAMKCEFQMELILNNTTYSVLEEVSSLTLNIGGETIGMSDMDLLSHANDLKTGSDLVNVPLTYDIHGLSVA